MKKLALCVSLAAVALALGGCASHEIRTQKYFEDMPIADLEEVLDECKKADRLDETAVAECANAKRAFVAIVGLDKPAPKASGKSAAEPAAAQ